VTCAPSDGLKQGTWRLAFEVLAQTEHLESNIQALERIPSEGRGKTAQFIPIRFIYRNKLTRNDELLMAFDALVLSEMVGPKVGMGKVIHGDDHATLKVKTSGRVGQVWKVEAKITALLASESAPETVLNRRCPECEFRDRCRQKAIEKDDLSLLGGMTEKERTRHRSKGIFSVTQLSYTFRPRRTPKRAKHPASPHHFALQALALRENMVFIHGKPELPDSATQVYLDIEGLPDRDSYYLLGAMISSEGNETFHSFWADTAVEEVLMFSQFAKAVSRLEDFRIFHYGEYDTLALKHIKARLPQSLQSQVESMLSRSTNVLSVIHAHVYFPTTSNSLKDLVLLC